MDYRIDNSLSTVSWKAHQPENTITGEISFKQGKINVLEELITGGFAQIDLTTIKVTDPKLESDEQKKLESHLKSSDFFNVQDYPSAIFEAEDVRTSSGFTTHIVVGDMTIKGVKHKIEIPANIIIEKGKIDIKAKLSVIRTKFNLDFMIEESFGDKKILPEFDVEVHIVATS